MSKISGIISSAVTLVTALSVFCGCSQDMESAAAETSKTTQAAQTTTTAAEQRWETLHIETSALPEHIEEPPAQTSARLVFAGDNLIHTPIYRIANQVAGGNGYDFSPAYENLGTLISEADLAVLNQETIISDDFAPDTYPSFCTPSQMARDMTKLGFDAFSISNNHVLDKGEKGLISMLDLMEKNYPDVPVYGAYRNEADMDSIRTLEKNGITFAFLGYMEHTNGRSLPPSSECRVTYTHQEELIEKQVKRAAQISDCVIVSVHFGIEVSNIITAEQKAFSRKLADWGADIIVGTQPHTIQSMEYIDRADGGRSFVFYCLGNFISAMDNPLSMAEMLGRITVTKDSSGTVTLSDADAVPLVDHFDRTYSYIGVYPFDKYTREMAAKHAIAGVSYDFLVKLFKENIPEEFMAKDYLPLIYGEG